MTSCASHSLCSQEPASGPGMCTVHEVPLVPSEPLVLPVLLPALQEILKRSSGCVAAWLLASFQQRTLVLSPKTDILEVIYLALSKGMGGDRGGWAAMELGCTVGEA